MIPGMDYHNTFFFSNEREKSAAPGGGGRWKERVGLKSRDKGVQPYNRQIQGLYIPPLTQAKLF